MKRLSIYELSKILEKDGLTEELEFRGRINIDSEDTSSYTSNLFNYGGNASLIPPKASGHKYHILKMGDNCEFNFNPASKFKITNLEFPKNSKNLEFSIEFPPKTSICITNLEKIKY